MRVYSGKFPRIFSELSWNFLDSNDVIKVPSQRVTNCTMSPVRKKWERPDSFVCTLSRWKIFLKLKPEIFAEFLVWTVRPELLLPVARESTWWDFLEISTKILPQNIVKNWANSFLEISEKIQTSMHVPNPVLSLSVAVDKKEGSTNFGKALAKFQREDPTFRVHNDPQVKFHGKFSHMYHLQRAKNWFLTVWRDNYIWYGWVTFGNLFRKNEERVQCQGDRRSSSGNFPRIFLDFSRKILNVQVAFKETIRAKGGYNYLHRKQTGGSGQYARVSL